MDYSKRTYNELLREFDKLNEMYDEISDECIKEGLSYSIFCKRAYDIKKRIYFVSKYIRLKEEPTVEFGKNWDGDTYTLDEFISRVNDGAFIDDDGFGYYATDNGKSDIMIYPSDVLEKIYRNDFTHIIWFNR